MGVEMNVVNTYYEASFEYNDQHHIKRELDRLLNDEAKRVRSVGIKCYCVPRLGAEQITATTTYSRCVPSAEFISEIWKVIDNLTNGADRLGLEYTAATYNTKQTISLGKKNEAADPNVEKMRVPFLLRIHTDQYDIDKLINGMIECVDESAFRSGEITVIIASALEPLRYWLESATEYNANGGIENISYHSCPYDAIVSIHIAIGGAEIFEPELARLREKINE
jgi:hypothetical protein